MEALDCFNFVLNIKPENDTSWKNKGMVLAKLSKFDEALECFNTVLTLRRNYAQIWENKGSNFLKNNET
ncbi:MAG: tetratricopeptide repeat protein [Candidatus Lokiarchaeota archaeon]|nr:tetratricopeptide repeat protein [Candidatus Lokiarchaeota archaeon]